MKIQGKRLGMIGVVLAAAISAAADGPSKKSGSSPLHCQLVADQKSGGLETAYSGDLELRNDSKEPITIEYVDSPTDHLALDIRDPAGKLLPKAIPFYGGLYAQIRPVGAKQTFTIKPGETYRQNLALFAMNDDEAHPRVPGKYTVEAVYHWGKVELRSDKVTIEVKAK